MKERRPLPDEVLSSLILLQLAGRNKIDGIALFIGCVEKCHFLRVCSFKVEKPQIKNEIFNLILSDYILLQKEITGHDPDEFENHFSITTEGVASLKNDPLFGEIGRMFPKEEVLL